MKAKRYTDEQFTYALRQAEGGTPVPEVCRLCGVSEASFYLWKNKYGKLGLTEIRELWQPRDENSCVKRLVAALTLDEHILGENVQKKALRPARRRALVEWIRGRYGVSVHKAIELGRFSLGGWFLKSQARDTAALRVRIRESAQSLHASTRRLAREPQARVSLVSPGGPAGAHAGTTP